MRTERSVALPNLPGATRGASRGGVGGCPGALGEIREAPLVLGTLLGTLVCSPHMVQGPSGHPTGTRGTLTQRRGGVAPATGTVPLAAGGASKRWGKQMSGRHSPVSVGGAHWAVVAGGKKASER
jgi:hypothetical protein